MKNNKDFAIAIDEATKLSNQAIEEMQKETTRINNVFRNEYDKYQEDISKKMKLVNKKNDELISAQQKMEQNKATLKDKYASIVATGNEEEIKKIEEELIKIDTEISNYNSRIELLNKHTEKGDQKLYDNIVVAYVNQIKLQQETQTKISEYSKMISDAIEQLTAIKKDINNIHSIDNDDKMAKVYELFNNTIDVSGHHAGTDQNAKIRFIRASLIH